MFTARVLPANLQCDVEDGMTLLQALEAGRIEMPSSCRNGTCRACLARLVSGDIGYLVDWPGLLADEKAEGWILPCVALPRSDILLQRPQLAG